MDSSFGNLRFVITTQGERPSYDFEAHFYRLILALRRKDFFV